MTKNRLASTPAQYAEVKRLIRTRGFALTFSSDRSCPACLGDNYPHNHDGRYIPPVGYTVGLVHLGGCEIAVTGYDKALAQDTLHRMAIAVASKDIVPEHNLVLRSQSLQWPQFVQLRRVSNRSGFRMVRGLYGPKHSFKAWQLVIPDRRGRFPDDVGYDTPPGVQPLW